MVASSRLRIAVIGTGMSSFGALVALLEDLDNFDIDVYEASAGIDLDAVKPFGKFSKQMSRDIVNVEMNNAKSFVPKYSPGGWSRYWGGTVLSTDFGSILDCEATNAVFKTFHHVAEEDGLIRKFPLHGSPSRHRSIAPAIDYVIEKLDQYESKNISLTIGKSRLAFEPRKDSQEYWTGNVGFESIEDEMYQPLNTFNQIQEWSFSGLLKLHMNMKVTRYRSDSNSVSLWAEREDEDCLIGVYDYVFAGVGILETVNLLRNSHETFRNLKFLTRETPLSIVPALIVSKKYKCKTLDESITLSLPQAFLQMESGEQDYIFSQIYAFSGSFIKDFSFVLSKLVSFIRFRLLFFMVFESDLESKLDLDTLTLSLPCIRRIRRRFKLFYRYRAFRKILKDVGIFVLPFNLFRQPTAASYHYDGLWYRDVSKSNYEFERMIDNDGQIISMKGNRFYFLGASNQQEQVVGPTAINFSIKSFTIVKRALS